MSRRNEKVFKCMHYSFWLNSWWFFSWNLRMWSGSLVMLSMICRRPEQPSYPATSSGWQIRSWQRWTRPILWAHLFMWHFTKAIWLTRPFELLHLLLLFRNIAGFIPTHKVIRFLKFSIRFDLIILVNMAATSCSQFSCPVGIGACLYESCLEWQDLLSSSTSFFSSEISRVSYLLIRLLGCQSLKLGLI